MGTINTVIKKIAKKIHRVKHSKSYSQSGEDMILNTIFSNIEKGTYVDVGACNPYYQSNTQFFYDKGWSGINIDANEESIKNLNEIRTRDKNVLALISDKEEELEYFYYENPFYNGCVYNQNIPSKLLYSKKMKSTTLTQIFLSENLTNINFLSIDVEGYDYKVLASLDLNSFKPQVIVVESFQTDINSELKSDSTKLLDKNGYLLMGKTVTNSIYILKEFAKKRFDFS